MSVIKKDMKKYTLILKYVKFVDKVQKYKEEKKESPKYKSTMDKYKYKLLNDFYMLIKLFGDEVMVYLECVEPPTMIFDVSDNDIKKAIQYSYN